MSRLEMLRDYTTLNLRQAEVHYAAVSSICNPHISLGIHRNRTDQAETIIPFAVVPPVPDDLAIACEFEYPDTFGIRCKEMDLVISGQKGFIIQGLTIPAENIPRIQRLEAAK
ncbi:MAG: hypothetical protein V3U36_07005, partial [Anaerolineales bacterium]